jgi:hypothetical protein
VSLQGTLDTFALPDVLRLLASTQKTGHLRLDGDRGPGNVWVDAGHVVAADAENCGRAAPVVEVFFELLRNPDGSFVFDADITTSDAGAPAEVEPLLAEAEELLSEWREIEAVVPSTEAWVQMAPELSGPRTTVTAEQWRMLVAVGSGATVEHLAETFDLGELAVCRAVKGLVEAGLTVVAADPDDLDGGGDDDERAPVPAPTPAPPKRAKATKATAARRSSPPRMATTAAASPEAAELAALAEDSEASPPELARQLAELGPEAAAAVAAAAQATTPEEREAALANLPTDSDGEPINRGVLLKFLSSVRS